MKAIFLLLVMPPYTVALIITAWLSFTGIPEGYQDTTGFHYGRDCAITPKSEA
ncbi:MAG: hypothetical protein KGI69_02585 [Patescibacteria group bacterium]|nr:hypothetical protein [Patescibacteria group bacterium]